MTGTDQGMCIQTLTLEPGRSITAKNQAITLYFAHAGSGLIVCKNAEYTVKPGDALRIEKGAEHRISAEKDELILLVCKNGPDNTGQCLVPG